MDRTTQKGEAKYHTWHLLSGLTYRTCRKCRLHGEILAREQHKAIYGLAYANLQHPAIAWSPKARRRCGLPDEDENILQPATSYSQRHRRRSDLHDVEGTNTKHPDHRSQPRRRSPDADVASGSNSEQIREIYYFPPLPTYTPIGY